LFLAPGGRGGLRSRLDWIVNERKRVKYWGDFVRRMESILVHTDSENISMMVGYKLAIHFRLLAGSYIHYIPVCCV
jgi:hypothetical protein